MQQSNKILLLESDNVEKNKLIDIFESWGFNTSLAIDGLDAIEKARDDKFALLVSNFELEDVDNIELLNTVTLNNDDTKVLFLAKNPSVDGAVTAMRNGAIDFLVKPITSEQLQLALKNIFSRQSDKKRQSLNINKQKGLSIVTKNSSMIKMLEIVKKIANSNASVLIQGESGTGKELFANFIHQHSLRRDKDFIAINCAVLPENLLESELFGHEKGSFTGAIGKKIGKFELANGGTIFLDEITEMQYKLQAKILRVIQERELDRIGGIKPIPIDVRIIATTNRKIEDAVEKQEFREDLFYRLNVVPLKIPPLRHRKDDIEHLCKHFIDKYNKIDNRNVKTLTKEALDSLLSHSFRGNVRELENIIQRSILFSDGELIRDKDLLLNENWNDLTKTDDKTPATSFPDSDNNGNVFTGSLQEIEKKAILQTIDATKGNRTRASELLGISVRTLRNKLKEYNSVS